MNYQESITGQSDANGNPAVRVSVIIRNLAPGSLPKKNHSV